MAVEKMAAKRLCVKPMECKEGGLLIAGRVKHGIGDKRKKLALWVGRRQINCPNCMQTQDDRSPAQRLAQG